MMPQHMSHAEARQFLVEQIKSEIELTHELLKDKQGFDRKRTWICSRKVIEAVNIFGYLPFILLVDDMKPKKWGLKPERQPVTTTPIQRLTIYFVD